MTREPQLDALAEQIESYLRGPASLVEFWTPVAQFLSENLDEANDPTNRSLYCARRIANLTMGILHWGYPEQEPDLREFLQQWLVALRLSERAWNDVLAKHPSPLDYLDDGSWPVISEAAARER